jgi:2,3-bisphosphoglycerate-dependent phosphoglycerate mutase
MRDRNLRLAMELLLIRHALPVRIEGATGPADPPLAEIGRRQADALAEWLADEPLDAIYTSPLRRALETAAPLASRHSLVAIVEDDIAEFDREADSYVPIEELKAEDDPRWHQMVAGEWTSDGTVDPAAFAAGVIAGVERIIAAHSGQTVAIVAHGGVVNVYLAHILGTTRPMFFEPAYTSISRVLAARSGQRQVRSVNETAHVRDVLTL